MTQRRRMSGAFHPDPFEGDRDTRSGRPSRGQNGFESARGARSEAFFATSASGAPLIHKTTPRLTCERRHLIELTGTRNEM
ncbi:MAG: hypothetical protein CBC48_07545 [bacterium TMED88]|nr:MAG: hypothetical protein CBC48_07545 [bacterium TMED88]